MTGNAITLSAWVSLLANVFKTGALISAAKKVVVLLLGLVASFFGFLLICLWPVAKTQSMKDREER